MLGQAKVFWGVITQWYGLRTFHLGMRKRFLKMGDIRSTHERSIHFLS